MLPGKSAMALSVPMYLFGESGDTNRQMHKSLTLDCPSAHKQKALLQPTLIQDRQSRQPSPKPWQGIVPVVLLLEQ